jgi:hypothetical protein
MKNLLFGLPLITMFLFLVGCSGPSQPADTDCDVRLLQPLTTGSYWIYEVVDGFGGPTRIDSIVVQSIESHQGKSVVTLDRFTDDSLYARYTIDYASDSLIDNVPWFDNDLRIKSLRTDEYGNIIPCVCPPLRRKVLSCAGRVDSTYTIAPGDTLPSLGPNGDVVFSITEFRRTTSGFLSNIQFGNTQHQSFVNAPNTSENAMLLEMNIADSMWVVEPENAVFEYTGRQFVESRAVLKRCYVQGVGITSEYVHRITYSADSTKNEESKYQRKLLRYQVK